MSSDPLHLILSVTVGVALGTFYFWGLWLTVQRLPGHRNPQRLLLFSFFVRALPVLLVFWYMTIQHPLYLIAAMAGFFAVRVIAMRIVNSAARPEESNAA